MKKTLALAGAVAFAASVGMAAPAQASSNAGANCAQAGIGTLKDLGLLQAAAQKQIDYSTLADAEAGPIFADLPEGSNLSLGQVVKLHTKSPELFAWCR
ncbi:MAG: hypothetical protein ABI720_10675 [Actinomycetes bacterium]